jgi:spore maturation protein CgeB
MLTVAAILDEFSETCFSPECKLIPLKSTDYLSRLRKSGKIDLVLAESVWRGPANSWSHYLVNNKKHPVPYGLPILKKLIRECRKLHIPTLFWAKEDPVHFNHFIVSASMFDWIATTDVNCVPQYKSRLKHNRIFALPFAAQPAIHNPRGLVGRMSLACFAGACRNKQYPNRGQSMDFVLKPAIKYGLHIYDRHKVGSSGEDFPAIYKSCVQGGVPYSQMLEKYKEYRVFLNVNSIDTSPTMFSRRVFELLACGTPVISSPSVGIEKMLPEVLISHNEKETEQHLQKLLSNDEYWKQVSTAGIARIQNGHTYAQRIKTICNTLQIKGY